VRPAILAFAEGRRANIYLLMFVDMHKIREQILTSVWRVSRCRRAESVNRIGRVSRINRRRPSPETKPFAFYICVFATSQFRTETCASEERITSGDEVQLTRLSNMKKILWWTAQFISYQPQQHICYHSSSLYGNTSKMTSTQCIPIIPYLKETIQAVDPCFRLAVGEQHRKSMMRAIMKISKVQMDEDLRQLRAKIHWSKADCFVRDELISLTPPSDAQQFQEGLDKYKAFEPNHTKLFSFLARGRTYQGKLAKLLQDVKPELVPTFQQIVDPIPELELLECYAREQHLSLQELLLRCVHAQFPKAPTDSPDAGKAKGIKGETSLQTYLETKYPDKRVLSNVFISKKPRSGKQKNLYVIQLPSSLSWDGMTSELDALVLEPTQDGDESVVVIEVWEAKATLHPITLHDALSKKHAAVAKIFETNDVRLLLEGKEDLAIQQGTLPGIGIFGNKLLSPVAAARRSQVLACENVIGTSRRAVEHALGTGEILVPHEQVLSDLKRTLRLAEEIQPTVVIGSAAQE
jgi:hypothetical protein